MPNQRDPEKKQLAFFVNKEIYAKFKKVAETLDMTMTALIIGFMIEKIETYEKKHGRIK